MQTLDVISVNLWQIVISLLNLLILFLLLKKFLYKPVRNVLEKRRAEIDLLYSSAEDAKKSALDTKNEWDEKIKGAQAEADSIIREAASKATRRGDKLLADAKEKADDIMHRAQTEAELEMKKAQEGIKREIVDVSAALTEKMLGREINENDHRSLIDSFIEKIGDNDETEE